MVKLDYNASFPVTGIPSIESNPGVPGHSGGFRDFVPKKPLEKQARIIKDTQYRAPLRKVTSDFISRDEANIRDINDREQIKALAQQMWQEQKNRRLAYADAKKTVDAMTDEDRAHPTSEMESAMRILQRRAPMNKEEIIEAARRQFYGKVSV